MIDRNVDCDSRELPGTNGWQQRVGALPPTARTSPNAALLSQQINLLIGHRLSEVERELQRIADSRDVSIRELTAHATGHGGKRLRPILALLAAELVSVGKRSSQSDGALSANGSRDTLRVATMVELVHAASLVHDDLLDGADERRHSPTVGKLVGAHGAVLLGDLLFSSAFEFAARCRCNYPARRIAKTAALLCEGELRQQQVAHNWELTRRDYFSILRQKTGALCGASCQLGGWSTGATKNQRKALWRFGEMLGVAFQVCDDWLDYWGSDQVGKSLGTDLQQGKPTLPVIRLLQTVNEKRRKEVMSCLREGSTEARSTLLFHLNNSDASEYTLRYARKLATRAEVELGTLPDCTARTYLAEIARNSVRRTQ